MPHRLTIHSFCNPSTNKPLPREINLGIFGTFQTQKYIPKPISSFRCQHFGHHQARCRASTRCAICAQSHATEGCLAKHMAGKKTSMKCPNWGGNHHGWNLHCEKWQALLPKDDPPAGPPTQWNSMTGAHPMLNDHRFSPSIHLTCRITILRP